ncbi:uncharacterized protein VP01_1628g2 [Puccinia sorghi]|uniref:Chromo domain-containing protein n=1 Tax=Puccinia sorghi TaxID=27349 RepID=A0A0L6VIR5_9BASI|nr:uncharacterized protein VP01_1628g2 [Puccinia sorghi]
MVRIILCCIYQPLCYSPSEKGEVIRILDSRLCKGQLQFLVEWTGYQSNQDQTSWEPPNHLQPPPDLVHEFCSTYSHKSCQSS